MAVKFKFNNNIAKYFFMLLLSRAEMHYLRNRRSAIATVILLAIGLEIKMHTIATG